MARLRIAPSSPDRLADLLDRLADDVANNFMLADTLTYDHDAFMRAVRLLLRWNNFSQRAATYSLEGYALAWRGQYPRQRFPGMAELRRQWG